MAKDNKKLVQAITSQEENFAQWYTDICVKAELVEYSSVKGFIILRPYGQAIWELIQKDMDARFKATGHENVAMPVLIPESLLQKEGELVNGFAPEVAWVTMGGSDKLEERLAVRPTSETMFCDHWSRVLHSYRELPMKYNQWCSVVRWEKTTRPFLRSREFWWQEGHTIHETAAEAEAETQQQLNCYADVCEQDLAIPVVKGRKTDKEKFAGAEATYTIEAMMKDGKDMPFDVKRVTEDVKFSWFADSTSGKPFTKGENVLEVDKKGAYSFVKAPLYNGKPMEVGPLARMWVNNKPISPIGQKLFKEYFGLDVKNFRDMGEDLAFSLLGRHVARAEESYLMLDVVERFLKEVRPDEETFSMPVMKDSEGFGFTEAPRGSLMHFTKVRNGKIDNYQIVSATLWNCAPRNDTGMRGALEEALIGVPVPDIENPVNIARLIRAFDP